ncbi:MAG: hypothetical protein Q9222_004328 [Ikaeria aurantiellina]
MDNDRNLPNHRGRKRLDFTIWDFDGGGKFYTAFPPYHLAGVVATVIVPIFSESATPVLGPSTRPASGAIVRDIMYHNRLKSLFVPPSILEQLLQEPGSLEAIAKLEWLAYTGGPLSPSAGDVVCRVVDLCQYFGITETLPLQQLVPSREDWSYIEWNPCRKIEMQRSDDDSYELVVISDDTSNQISGLDHNYPGVRKWHTKDLFRPHPTKPNLWRFHGRKDDIVVLSNGEKFYPVPMESLLQGHSSVTGALVVGQGKIQAALLLEPHPNVVDSRSFIKEVWPIVEQANSLVPAHGRITLSRIVVLPPGRTFERAGKGTVVRRITEQTLGPEIEAMYGDEDPHHRVKGPVLTIPPDLANVRHFVRSCIASCIPSLQLTDHDDIFLLGVDSLQATTIGALLKSGLSKRYKSSELAWLSEKALYIHPSIDLISQQIYYFLNQDAKSVPVLDTERPSRTVQMATLVGKYTQDLPSRSEHRSPSPQSDGLRLILTGSTGALGPHLFHSFLEDTSVAHIYALNRSPDARERHHTICRQCNLPPPPDSKVTYITTDFSCANFGVSRAVLQKLHSDVDIIIHNAWKVDFKHSLLSYDAVHLRGIRQLIDFSLGSSRLPRIVFVSSVSAVGNWVLMHRNRAIDPAPAIPETFIHDFDAAQQMGYGESKHVAERIFETASAECGIPVTVLRVGQIAGSTRQQDVPWPQQEWIPSVIKTAKAVGVLPTRLAPVEWIPVDRLACVIGEIIRTDLLEWDVGNTSKKARVYNLVNPVRLDWSSLVPVLQEKLQIAKAVDLKAWIESLARLGVTDLEELRSKPALKLLDLLNDLEAGDGDLLFETSEARGSSATLREMEAVNDEWMSIWLDQWGFQNSAAKGSS